MLSIKKKTALFSILCVFIFVISAAVFFKPQPAHAQSPPPAPAGGMPVVDIGQKIQTVLEKVWEGLKIAVINAVVNFLDYFMQKIAYDSAVYLASGGQGQTPMIFTSDAGEYFKNTADEAAGKAIEAFSAASGLNLCEIPDVNLDLSLKVGLRSKYGPPAPPKCTATKMAANWGDEEAWKSKYSALKDKVNPAKVFADSVSLDDSDLGISMNAIAGIDRLQAKKVDAAKADRVEGQGAKAVKETISGKTVTPAQVVKEEVKEGAPAAKKKESTKSFGSVLGAGTWQVIPSSLSTFFNTLLSNGLKNIMSGGMFPSGDNTKDPAVAYSYTDASSGGRRRAEEIFSSILIPTIRPVEQYDILSHMANCPETPGIYNCVIDSGFSGAVSQAKLAKPVTIKEAIKKGYLNGSWKLVPPSDPALDTSKLCYTKAYCHSNIKKLRQTGILSLGFEIAAKNSNPDKPWTLDQVVKGFNDCNYANDGVTVVPDPRNKPFCHLIDPEWVLTVAETRCNALGYTNNLVDPASADRQQECVDLSTCVAKDTNGACIAYGYCTRSKNVWRIDGDKCNAQNSTCISYKDSKNKVVSYLYSTLDTQNCNANNVGCNLYSTRSVPTASSSQNWVGFGSNDLNNLKNDTVSPVVFFNKNASSKCASAGCSMYLPGNSLYGTSPFYLKKAPDYLGCYDASTTTPGIQWPQSLSDLKKIDGHADCKDYAQVCIPEEENCSLYKQAVTNDIIPGKFKPGAYITQSGKSVYQWNDQCHSSCEGYDAYREMPSSYSGGQSLAYIIPSTAAACTYQESGCSGFTNLATTTGNIEKIEYYTYLRPCILPNKTTQKTFYTYEGGSYSGFQLKVYVLEIDPLDPNTNKGPKYYRTPKEKSDHNATCREDLYKAKSGALSPDCRQFTDSDGNAFYVKLADTIVVDKTCTPYRLNKTETFKDTTVTKTECDTLQGRFDGTNCNLCFNDGFYRDGYCYNHGLPSSAINNGGNSQTCTSAVDSCRPYKGNSANNIEKVVLNSGSSSQLDNFEYGSVSVDMENWDCAKDSTSCGLALSNESTRSGEHSLGLSTNTSVKLLAMEKTIQIVPGNSYTVSFWMKSDATRSVKVNFGLSTTTVGTIAVSDAWQYYKLGPIEISKTYNSATDTLRFAIENSKGAMYLDNLQITKINNYAYLVKDKLSVPSACDENLNDNLPGQALGCTKYTAGASATSQNDYYLTGFSYLCREEAIGCIPLIDTYNTVSTKAELYNVWLTGTSGKKASATVDGVEYACQVKSGDTGCYVANIPGYSPKAITNIAGNIKITSSTLYIPADTPSTTPNYLVVNSASSCNSSQMGCSYVGKETQTINGSKYESVLVINNPALYSKNLCQAEGMGCGTYSSAEGNLYFKDPAITGQKICKYQKSVTLNGSSYKGWFWKDVGSCGTTTAKGVKTLDPATTTYCSSDTDCSKNKTGYTSCLNKDTLPCYPNFIQNQNEFGIWPFGNTNQYNGYVGECPSAQSGCTEFRDPADKDKSYYLLNNDKIKTAKQDCTNGVSDKTGCVLFNQTDLPTKPYSSKLTYAASKAKDYIAVPPVSSSTIAGNDSNMVMKVIRDRECGEWLYCRSSENVWDALNSKWNQRCDVIGRCNSASTNSEDSDGQNCTNPLDNHSLSNRLLTEDYYKRRPIDWDSLDYIGYSILDMFPVEELRQINIGTATSTDYRLTKYLITNGDCDPKKVEKGITGYCTDGVSDGKCIQKGVCIISPKGGVTTKSVLSESPPQNCRSYPTKDSPYPYTKAAARSSVFQKVNFCSEKYVTGGSSLSKEGILDCECQFTKQVYGDNLITKYWKYDPFGNSNDINMQVGFKKATDDDVSSTLKYDDGTGLKVYGKEKESKWESVSSTPEGLCYNSGIFDDLVCEGDYDCRDYSTTNKSGLCMKRKKEESYIGWGGYCLEEDRSRSLYGQNDKFQCLSWFPIDNISGSFDLSSNPKSGYMPPSTGGEYYCMEERGNYTSSTSPYKVKLAEFETGHNGNKDQFYKFMLPKDKQFETKQTVLVKDIDYLEVVLSPNTKVLTYEILGIKLEVKGSGEVVKLGTYIMRNDSKNLTKNAVTEYGSAFEGDKDQVPPKGCAVSEATSYLNGGKAYLDKDKKRSGIESCFAEKDNVKVEARLSDDAAETRKYTYYGGKTIFRLFVDNRDEDSKKVEIGTDHLAHYSAKIDYISNGYGFFTSIGDPSCAINTGVKLPARCGDTKICDNGYENDQITFELYAMFDANGKLEQIGSASCHAGDTWGSEWGKFNVTVYAHLREYCTKVVDVADGGMNIAYTDNVWKDKSPSYLVLNNLAKYKMDNIPFGSLKYRTVNEIVGKTFDIALLYGPRQIPNNAKLGTSGIPFGCPDGRKCGGISSATGFDVKYNTPIQPNLGLNGYSLYKNLFAKSNAVYSLFNTSNNISNNFPNTKDATLDFNVTETLSDLGKAPRVRAILSKECISGSKEKCKEGKDDTITINGISGGDVLLIKTPGVANLQFYMIADKNQMPVKRIKVDWDDGYPEKVKSGMFGNYRGIVDGKCGSSKTCLVPSDDIIYDSATKKATYSTVDYNTKLKCESDDDCEEMTICRESNAPTFGRSEDACNSSYFKFVNTYTCSVNSKNYQKLCTEKDSIQGKYKDGCCVFHPRVRVKDNWGWYNSNEFGCKTIYDTTIGVSPGGDGCYDANQLRPIKIDVDEGLMYGNNAWTSTSTIRVILPPK